MPFAAAALLHAVVFGITVFGLGAPLAARVSRSPAERPALAAAFGLLGVYVAGAAIYLAGVNWSWLWLLPIFGLAGLCVVPGGLASWWQQRDIRAALAAWGATAAWTAGLLALVNCYTGGGWSSDSLEHHERALFFLHHWPLEHRFIGLYSLAARPPLGNVVTASFLALSGPSFAWTQFTLLLCGSLTVLPLWLLARRFRPEVPALAIATVAMLSPMFVQNATFAWTKLPTAFFVLTALHFFLAARSEDSRAGPIAAMLLAAGALCHYSALPYAAVLLGVVVVAIWKRASWTTPSMLLRSSATFVALFGSWIAWSWWTGGAQATFLSNTTAAAVRDRDVWDAVVAFLLNVRDTLVPHVFRSPTPDISAQASAWGRLRDVFFNLYQINLPFAFGVIAGPILAFHAVRSISRARPRPTFWIWFVFASVCLGIAAHSPRDQWGLAHICLQPIVFLGLAWMVSSLPDISGLLRWLLAAGAIVDVLFGIVLHYTLQNAAGWTVLTGSVDPAVGLSESAAINFHVKQVVRLDYFGDRLAAPPLGVATALAALLLGTIAAWRRSQKASPDTTRS